MIHAIHIIIKYIFLTTEKKRIKETCMEKKHNSLPSCVPLWFSSEVSLSHPGFSAVPHTASGSNFPAWLTFAVFPQPLPLNSSKRNCKLYISCQKNTIVHQHISYSEFCLNKKYTYYMLFQISLSVLPTLKYFSGRTITPFLVRYVPGDHVHSGWF